jgi:hypothetical protein
VLNIKIKMINQSKKNDPRFWDKWRESGAIATDARQSVTSYKNKKPTILYTPFYTSRINLQEIFGKQSYERQEVVMKEVSPNTTDEFVGQTPIQKIIENITTNGTGYHDGSYPQVGRFQDPIQANLGRMERKNPSPNRHKQRFLQIISGGAHLLDRALQYHSGKEEIYKVYTYQRIESPKPIKNKRNLDEMIKDLTKDFRPKLYAFPSYHSITNIKDSSDYYTKSEHLPTSRIFFEEYKFTLKIKTNRNPEIREPPEEKHGDFYGSLEKFYANKKPTNISPNSKIEDTYHSLIRIN